MEEGEGEESLEACRREDRTTVKGENMMTRRRRVMAGGREGEDKGSAPTPLRLRPALLLLGGIGEPGVVLVRRHETAGVSIEIEAGLETEEDEEEEGAGKDDVLALGPVLQRRGKERGREGGIHALAAGQEEEEE